MHKEIIVTADDFGLTRGVTDTILDCVDNGALTRVSVLPNGLAVDYALREWQKRSEKISLSIHLNLTEGKALLPAQDLPHLVDQEGNFLRSPFSLFVKTLISLPSDRSALLKEIRNELTAQIECIKGRVGNHVPLSVDGHQHVQMIPLVFSAILSLQGRYNFKSVRLPHEPLFFDKTSWRRYFGFGMFRHIVLNFFYRLAKVRSSKNGTPHPDFFIGTLMSGSMNTSSVKSALGEVYREKGSSVEIGFHPGGALPGEVSSWKGDTIWHYSPWREYERTVLKSKELKEVFQSFLEERLPSSGSHVSQICRFIVAGSLATATNLGVLYLFTEFLGFWYIFSAIVAFLTATIFGFIFQKFWVFSHHSLKSLRREILFFLANNILGLIFTMAGLYVLVEYAGFWYMAGQVVVLFFVAVWNFFIYNSTIFKKEKLVSWANDIS